MIVHNGSLERGSESLTFFTRDHTEAVDAFLEKRKPEFQGR